MIGKQQKRTSRTGVDGYGRTPLHNAAANGLLDEVTQLLSSGADVNAQDDHGWSPLHFAAQASSENVTCALLAAGAKTELTDSNGNTPLWRAVFASNGNGAVIRRLLNAGANPNAANSSDVTPLILARRIGNYDVAKFCEDL